MSALQQEIKEAVRQATAPLHDELSQLKKMVNKAIVEKDTPLISLRDAARVLGVHEATLRRKVHKGSLPCKRIGKKIFFERSEIFTN